MLGWKRRKDRPNSKPSAWIWVILTQVKNGLVRSRNSHYSPWTMQGIEIKIINRRKPCYCLFDFLRHGNSFLKVMISVLCALPQSRTSVVIRRRPRLSFIIGGIWNRQQRKLPFWIHTEVAITNPAHFAWTPPFHFPSSPQPPLHWNTSNSGDTYSRFEKWADHHLKKKLS
jgi:hypothetical protein